MRVVVTAAASADGKVGAPSGEGLPVGGPENRDRIDRMRAAADAVAVGVETVLADDPHLTLAEEERRVSRLRSGRPGHPRRVVVDPLARTPDGARVLDDDAATTVLVTPEAPAERRERIAAVEGVEAVAVAGTDDGRVDPTAALAPIADTGVDRLLVEGGRALVCSLFEAGLVDEFSVFVGALVVGGREAPTVVDGAGLDDPADLDLVAVDRVDDGVVLDYEA